LVCYHSINDIPCPYNSLKSASNVNQQSKQLLFSKEEISLLNKSLEICRYVITKNQAQYQTQDILQELTIASNIINSRQNNSQKLKGASSNICNKEEHLTDLLKLCNLI
jgi:hypothetical protein